MMKSDKSRDKIKLKGKQSAKKKEFNTSSSKERLSTTKTGAFDPKPLKKRN